MTDLERAKKMMSEGDYTCVLCLDDRHVELFHRLMDRLVNLAVASNSRHEGSCQHKVLSFHRVIVLVVIS